MASNAVVLNDNSWLSKADKAFHKLETVMVILSGLAVAGLVVLAVVSVSGRMFFGKPLYGYIDWIGQLMPVIAFMGASYALRNGSHIRMDMLVSKLKGRAYYLAELITTLFITLLVILLAWGAFAHFERSFDFTQPLFSRDSSIDIGLPLWPAKLLVPIAFSTMVVRAILQVLAYTSALIYNPKIAIAVPLIQDVNQQAEAEAAQLLGKD